MDPLSKFFLRNLGHGVRWFKNKSNYPKYFIEYKKELDGEHQLKDIKATEEYLIHNQI